MSQLPNAQNIRPVREKVVWTILGEEALEKIAKAGLRAVAIRCVTLHPEEGTPAEALVCRLYPTNPDAQILFAANEAECAQTVYFPEPDEPFELWVRTGFHNAYIAAQRVLTQDLRRS